jgi:hypothetical protein
MAISKNSLKRLYVRLYADFLSAFLELFWSPNGAEIYLWLEQPGSNQNKTILGSVFHNVVHRSVNRILWCLMSLITNKELQIAESFAYRISQLWQFILLINN